MAKVSVVIPTHDRPDRLANAIRSVLGQTEKDIEVFVVDDGSPNDATAEVVHAFDDARVSYIRLQPPPKGPGAARNAGIKRATAQYVAFLDDDDEWLPEKLEVQLAALEGSESSLGGLYTARITVDEVLGKTLTTRCQDKRFDPRKRNVITTSSVLMKRACFEKVGFFDETLLAAQDFDMWIRIGELFELRYLDRPLVKYFIHHGYRITDDNVRRLHAEERFLEKHRRIYESNRRRHCRVYVNMGLRYHRLGDRPRAIRALQHAIWLWPLEPRIYRAFIRLLLGSQR